jgi:mono/diheme cytochrome c family protein
VALLGSKISARLLGTVAVLAVLAALSTSCSWNLRTGEASVYGIARFTLPAFPETGPHFFVVFSEMHFSPAYRNQDLPRILPPEDSVPITGREVILGSLDEYRPLTVPESARAGYHAQAATHLYNVNCLVCHGAAMAGDGPMKPMITGGAVPANLMADLTVGATPGELFAYITHGGRQGYALTQLGRESVSPMAEYRYLLTEDERWQLVLYLMQAQGR